LGRIKRIGLDAHMAGGRETGNETYVRGLVSGFSELDQDFELNVYHVGREWTGDAPHLQFHRLVTPSPWIRLTIDLPARSIRDGLDLLHTTYSAPIWARCPVVVTVHDISFVVHPEWFSQRDLRVLSRMVPWSIEKAKRVITVSEICRAEIIEHYGVPSEKVVSIPNAAGPSAGPISEAEAHEAMASLGMDPRRRYVLAVGNVQPRKNLVRLLSAFRSVVASGLDVDLVVVGPERYRAEDVLVAAKEARDRVRFTGYLSDRKLAACYALAAAFVFPSLYEGFGIPALEAMAHGVPVVSSQGGALPEVCGDAALYFDPLNVAAMANAIYRALTDTQLREDLIAAGHAREKEFTWRHSAEKTLAVYEDALR
jgi:glycosyltransferase involved in cell wall biosynthesis